MTERALRSALKLISTSESSKSLKSRTSQRDQFIDLLKTLRFIMPTY